jgi:hypothetical protein
VIFFKNKNRVAAMLGKLAAAIVGAGARAPVVGKLAASVRLSTPAAKTAALVFRRLSSGPPTTSALTLRQALVKIGADGVYGPAGLEPNKLLGLDNLSLLETLAGKLRFSPDLKDVKLSTTKVHLLRNVAGEEPTNAEEQSIVELKGIKTIGDLLPQVSAHKDGLLFVRVTPPLSPPTAAGL